MTEKRIIIRILFDNLELAEAAEIEEKIEDLLTKYPANRIEVTAFSPPPESPPLYSKTG